jgi:glyoxylase-like metal-dependent hydrolase (beta-lactamase superfamily II)
MEASIERIGTGNMTQAAECAHGQGLKMCQATQSRLQLSATALALGSIQRKHKISGVTAHSATVHANSIPPDCPFSIRAMNEEKSLFLVREKDKYGEYPNIYARILHSPSSESNPISTRAGSLIVLCDTGCGTNIKLKDSNNCINSQKEWNIGSFLEATINPQNRLPYLIITSHCHFDHILGIKNLNLSASTVLCSAYDRSFITPRSHLAEHSICNDMGIAPPKYDIGIWAKDLEKVVIMLPRSSQKIATGIIILQTPGHTPDSLTWYDSTLSPPHIFVGDSLYERQSKSTKSAKWGREPPMPTIFNVNSNLGDWQRSMNKVIKFIQERNAELKVTASEADKSGWVLVSQAPGKEASAPRVMLGAAHVTVSVDAEDCLLEMGSFMQRILQNEVPHCRVEDEKGHEVWLWDDLLDADIAGKLETGQKQHNFGRFSVRAPLFVIEKARAGMEDSVWSAQNMQNGDWIDSWSLTCS